MVSPAERVEIGSEVEDRPVVPAVVVPVVPMIVPPVGAPVMIAPPVAMLGGLRKWCRTVRASAFGHSDSPCLALLGSRLLSVILDIPPLPVGDPRADAVVLMQHRTSALVDIRLGGVGVARAVAETFANIGAPGLHLGRRADPGLGLNLCLAGAGGIAATVQDRAIPAAVDMLDMIGLHPLDTLGAGLLARIGAVLACLDAVFLRQRSLGLAVFALA